MSVGFAGGPAALPVGDGQHAHADATWRAGDGEDLRGAVQVEDAQAIQQMQETAGKHNSRQAGKHAGRHAAKHARRQAGKQANAKSKFEFESESASKFGSDAEAYADAHFRIRI